MGKIGKIEDFPGDLIAAIVLVVATLSFTLIPPLSYTPVRVPLGLLMVLFVPGYTLIAALFPRKADLDGIERVALSFGLSIAVVPLMGLGLNYTPWGIRLTPVVVSISIFTLAMSAVSYIRRKSLPEDERFSVEFRKGLDLARAEVMADEKSRLDKALTIILIISIILSVTALVYVIVTPKQGEKFTEFYILGPKGKAYDYPTKVIAGNNSTVIVGVVNHEYATLNYTMDLNFDNSTILDQKMTLEHNQTWEHPVTYVLNHTGDEQKLEFLLYKEDNFTAPYRDLHLWVNVSSGIEPITRALMSANTSSITSFSENATIRTISNLNISPNFPPLDNGSGGDGGEIYGLPSTGLNRSLKGEKENITNAPSATIISATLGNISENKSGGNRSKALQGSIVAHSANVSMASARQNNSSLGENITIEPAVNQSTNKFIEGNISRAVAQKSSYDAANRSNVTNGSEVRTKVQANQTSNLGPVQLSSKAPRKTIVLGSRSNGQITPLG